LSLSPDYTDLKIGLARTKVKEGRVSEALNEVLQLVRNSPNNTDALYVLGLAYTKNNQLEEARTTLERGQTLAPTDAGFPLALAQLADLEHHSEEARRLYERVLQLEPQNEYAAAQLRPASFVSRVISVFRRTKG
jgi:Flp pilus assembly protein TadD